MSAPRVIAKSTAAVETDVVAPPFRLRRAALLVLFGLLVGTWSAACGIGGGIFAVPILHYAYAMPLKMAIGNSLVLVAASTSSATLAEVLRADSVMHWNVIAILIATSLVGTQFGFRAARALDAVRLKQVFCVVLTVVAAAVLFDLQPGPASDVVPIATHLDLRALDYVALAATGFGAGFVAPMLGIGGGLVAVPALFLGFPSLGYLGARGSSMVMSMFAAWQSVWLYRGDRHVHLATALWFAGGSLVGGWLGVELVHVPGFVDVAQRMLGVTLLFVAVRFAWDVWRARGARATAT